VYQHKRVMAMDEMIADILLLANDAVTVRVDDFATGHHRRCSIAEVRHLAVQMSIQKYIRLLRR
jgi:hypothetical protein